MKKVESGAYCELELYGLGNLKVVTLSRTVYLNDAGSHCVKYQGMNVLVHKTTFGWVGSHKAF